MKRIAESDLARVALAKGAAIAHDGKSINAAGQRLELARRETPKAAPEPAPKVSEIDTPAPPPEPDRSVEMLAAAVIHNGKQTAAIVETLARELRARQSSEAGADPSPIVEWKFSIQRDERTSLLTGITATATREGKP